MKFSRRPALVLAGAAAAALVVAGIAGKIALTPAHAVAVSPVPTAIVVNPSIGDTFSPAHACRPLARLAPPVRGRLAGLPPT